MQGAFAYSGIGTYDAYGDVSQMRVKKEKQYSTAGKTAAMILNELYPDFKDQCTYDTVWITWYIYDILLLNFANSYIRKLDEVLIAYYIESE